MEVGGSVLVHGSKGTTPNGELVGRDLATGAVLWQHPSRRPSTSTATPSTVMRCSSSPARPPRPTNRPGYWRPTTRAPGSCAGRRAAVGARRRTGRAGRGGRGAAGVAVRVALRRRHGAAARSGPLDRGGRHLRARAAGGALLRVARPVSARARHRARLAPRGGVPGARSCRLSSADLRLRSLSPRAERVLGARSQPRPVARHRRRRPAANSATVWPSFTTTGSSSPSMRRRPRCAGPTSAPRTRWPRPTPGVRSCS